MESFDHLVDSGNYLRFLSSYTKVSKEMLARAGNREILHPLLKNALLRIITTAASIRLRTREHFSTGSSVYTFAIEPSMLAPARQQVDEMEVRGATNEPYDLKNIPMFMAWIVETIQPLVDGYIGYRSVDPQGELRFHDVTKHAARWSDVYRHHEYANYHFDQSLVAFPFIVYLDDVGAENGPFTYVEGSDKQKQNYILRALHSAATHVCGLRGASDTDFQVLGALPSVFHGGDLVGTFTGPAAFNSANIAKLTGAAGTAVMFHGFNLVHSGGNPTNGKRKALFVNFRYPRAKAHKVISDMATKLYWQPLVG